MAVFFLCHSAFEKNFESTCISVMKWQKINKFFKYNLNSFALAGSWWCTDSSNEGYNKTQLDADSGGKKSIIKGN